MVDPANRHTNTAGGKYYLHPLTGERFDSVTTVLDLIDKGRLKIWSAGLAADMAFEHVPQLLAAILVPPCGNTHNRCYQKHGRDNTCERCPCGQCQPCWHRKLKWKHSAESSRRAQEGTDLHVAANQWITNGGREITLRPQVQPYFDNFIRWTEEYGLLPNNGDLGPGSWEQTECTLLNRMYMYAGTSDAAVWITRGRTTKADQLLDRLGGLERALVRVDYKSREKPDEQLYNDMPLQAVAYEACQTAMLPDGTEHPAPRTHARAILQVRPESYSFVPMVTDHETMLAFVGVLTCYRWIEKHGKAVFDPSSDVTGHPTVAPRSEVPTTGRYSEWITDAKVVELPELGHGADTKQWAGLPEPPAPEPAKPPTPLKARKTTKAKKAPEPDPFEQHNHPAQVQADAGGGIDRPATPIEKYFDIDPGKMDASRLSEPLPF